MAVDNNPFINTNSSSDNKNENYDIRSYDVYNRGYKSGANCFIFIGPIWIEEGVFVNTNSSVSKRPIYGYNDIKFNTVIQGRHLVEGSLSIYDTEPNYLINKISEYKNKTIYESSLRDYIINNRLLFTQKIASSEYMQELFKKMQIPADDESLKNIAQRIYTEVELISKNNNSLDPDNFELTVVRGNLYDDTAAITIYEDVQIVGSANQVVNQDDVLVEVYNFIARGTKPLTIPAPKKTNSYTILKSDFYDAIKEIIDSIITSMIETPPEINIYKTDIRTSLLQNTTKIGLGGILHPSTRFYGQGASFNELVYSFYIADPKEDKITSKKELYIYKNGEKVEDNISSSKINNNNIAEKTNIKGKLYFNFKNNYNFITINRENTHKHLKAISNVKIEPLSNKIGGSIANPQYARRNFNEGSLIPPFIVEPETFNLYQFKESDIDNITYSTMWCCLTGMRNSKVYDEARSEKYITELAMPLYSFTYINNIDATYNDNSTTLTIGIPVFIDMIGIEEASGPTNARAKQPIINKNHNNTIEWEFTDNGPKIIKLNNNSSIPKTSIYQESIIDVFCESISVQDHIPQGTTINEDLSNFNLYQPHFFEYSLSNKSTALAADFHKSFIFIPFIFEKQSDDAIPHATTVDGILGKLNGKSAADNLAYFLQKRNKSDDSCKYEFQYDWTFSNVKGLYNVKENIELNGVYFVNPREDLPEQKQLYVFWVMAVIPTYRKEKEASSNSKEDSIKESNSKANNSQNNQSTDEVSIITDITMPSGKYCEFYNIIRCDVLYHIESLFDIYNPNESIITMIKNKLKNIWNVITNIFGVTSKYAMPIKRNMEYIAAFVDGYSIDINVSEMVSILAKNIKLEDSLVSKLGLSEKNNITGTNSQDNDANNILNAARKLFLNDGVENKTLQKDRNNLANDIENQFLSDLETMILNKLQEYTTKRDITISDNIKHIDKYHKITIDYYNIIPPTNIVSWGLTPDGYEKLTNGNSSTTTNDSNFVIGGYETIE